jgi:prepilin-type N-terminal cleavage/methylation domain-containing protein
MRTGRRCRRGKRGFSLLEALIAAVILGVGLVALARLHISSVHGIVKSEDLGRAAEVARGIADTIATIPVANLPACAPGPALPPTWVSPPRGGCAETLGVTQNFNPVMWGGPACSTWYTGDGVPDFGSAEGLTDPLAGDGSVPDTGNFRVDVAISHHPNIDDFPSVATVQPGETPVQVVWVWVCWRDSNGNVHEVRSMRVL